MERDVWRVGPARPLSMALDRAAEVLKSGGLVLFPSDTAYVVASLARAGSHPSQGVDRLFNMKRRGRGAAFPWMVRSAVDLDVYGMDISDEARMLATCLWPGGLTLVVEASSAVPRLLARDDGTVALRCSASPIATSLINACALPLISTGANIHRSPLPLSFEDVGSEILSTVDFAIYDPHAECLGRSTIVDCSGDATTILREGCVPASAIDQVLARRTEIA